MALTLFVDGGCSGNGAKNIAARRMVTVVTDEDGMLLTEGHAWGGSNNIAELEAVRDALEWCAEHGHTAVEIRTDSRNNFSWVFGKKVGKQLNDRARVLDVRKEIDELRRSVALTLVWVPREENLAGHYIEENFGV
jgi:ribonuclease HI